MSSRRSCRVQTLDRVLGAHTESTAAAGTPSSGVASGGTGGSSTGATSEPPSVTANSGDAATLTLNGNNPAQWEANMPWQDNLGALFSHNGISETIYSTSTVDTTVSGTTTLDYWAVVPSSQQVLHATRAVVIVRAANDNAPPQDLPATGTIRDNDRSITPRTPADSKIVIHPASNSRALHFQNPCARSDHLTLVRQPAVRSD